MITQTDSIEKELRLVAHFAKMFEDWFVEITTFLKNNRIVSLGKEYNAHVHRESDFGFNLFNLISDKYKREELHSDMLKAFLDPVEKHKEGSKYLHLFLEFLVANSKGRIKINTDDYKNSIAKREKGKIDILILDADSKKAIIIENKITGAVDRPRQIPKYIDYVEGLQDGYKIDAVVYLVLGDNGKTEPDRIDWDTNDVEKVFGQYSKFVRVVAFNDRNDCLLNGWIDSCQKVTQNIDALLILRQYGSLIHELGASNMSKPNMEKFLQSMLEGENYNTALSIKSMLDGLKSHRAERIIDTFRNRFQPFSKILIWNGEVYFGQDNIDRLAIGIYIMENSYDIEFWDKDFFDKKTTENLAELSVKKINYTSILKINHEGSMVCSFKFPSEENQLYKFIEEFSCKLSTVCNPVFKRIALSE